MLSQWFWLIRITSGDSATPATPPLIKAECPGLAQALVFVNSPRWLQSAVQSEILSCSPLSALAHQTHLGALKITGAQGSCPYP